MINLKWSILYKTLLYIFDLFSHLMEEPSINYSFPSGSESAHYSMKNFQIWFPQQTNHHVKKFYSTFFLILLQRTISWPLVHITRYTFSSGISSRSCETDEDPRRQKGRDTISSCIKHKREVVPLYERLLPNLALQLPLSTWHRAHIRRAKQG